MKDWKYLFGVVIIIGIIVGIWTEGEGILFKLLSTTFMSIPLGALIYHYFK